MTNLNAQLIREAKIGNVSEVKRLLKAGADVHACNNDALCCAAERGRLEVVRELIKAGADVHVLSNYALVCAARRGYLDVVRELIKAGADVKDNWARRVAVENGYPEVAALLQGARHD